MTARIEAPPLSAQRLPASAQASLGARHALGGLLYDAPGGPGSEPWLAGLSARRLLQAGAMIDAWCSAGPLTAGRTGDVRWQHNGHWLYGAVDLDEAALGLGVEALARRAYADVFAALHEAGFAHLQRVWNYLPDINAAAGGIERYRQFNAGRQQAFLDAHSAAFEGSPAACALGTREGPFCVRFLAGHRPARPVENPRQVSAYHYPSHYGARSPSFSRAALVDAGGGQVALLVSGTSSIVGHASVHAGDAPAQTLETLRNLRAVIDAAHVCTTARFALESLECTVYVRHAEQAPAIRTTLESALGADAPALTRALFLEADICRTELLVEIEAHAFAPGRVNG